MGHFCFCRHFLLLDLLTTVISVICQEPVPNKEVMAQGREEFRIEFRQEETDFSYASSSTLCPCQSLGRSFGLA